MAMFFGHHLAEHDVEVDHDQQGDGERDRVQEPFRDAAASCSHGSITSRDRGLPDRTQHSEQMVMPSWVPADHRLTFSMALERGARHPRPG